jgi:hypothetical protein
MSVNLEKAFIVACIGLIVLTIVLFLMSKVPVVSREENLTLQMISGTEYRYGDDGQVIVSLLDGDFVALDANCTVDIYYPNKSIFVEDGVMIR